MRASKNLRVLAIAASVAAAACGSAQGPALRWFNACPVGACRQDAGAGAVACTGHQEGEACQDAGETCGTGGGCAGELVCAASDPATQPPGCPVSSRRFKQGIRYLDQKDLERIAGTVDHIRLATYSYKSDPSARERLGFIIEDDPDSPAVADGRTSVDLYAYTSMVVAAMKVQSQKLEEQGAEIAALRKELETLRAKPRGRH
jgi:hypothetical protein